MHYVALIQGEERQVEVTEISPGNYRVEIDGRSFDVDAAILSESHSSLLMGGACYDVQFDGSGADRQVLVDGKVHSVEVLDLRTVRLRKAQASAASHDGPAEISSPMPGKVVDILVKEGESVKAGQGLIIVEAMKMENELKSPKDGVVGSIKAVPGAAVDGGAVLCTVESLA
jgi:biotin carboxyl carrier protein